MIGKQVELQYQEQSKTTDGMGRYSVIWYGVRKIKGSLVLDMGRESFSEPFIAGKKEVKKDFIFFPRVPKGFTISATGRFYNEKDGRIFAIKLVDNPGEIGFYQEIYLQEIK